MQHLQRKERTTKCEWCVRVCGTVWVLTCFSIHKLWFTLSCRVRCCHLNTVFCPTQKIGKEHRVYVLAHSCLQNWSWNWERQTWQKGQCISESTLQINQINIINVRSEILFWDVIKSFQTHLEFKVQIYCYLTWTNNWASFLVYQLKIS